jgi:hypothetical protein
VAWRGVAWRGLALLGVAWRGLARRGGGVAWRASERVNHRQRRLYIAAKISRFDCMNTELVFLANTIRLVHRYGGKRIPLGAIFISYS